MLPLPIVLGPKCRSGDFRNGDLKNARRKPKGMCVRACVRAFMRGIHACVCVTTNCSRF